MKKTFPNRGRPFELGRAVFWLPQRRTPPWHQRRHTHMRHSPPHRLFSAKPAGQNVQCKLIPFSQRKLGHFGSGIVQAEETGAHQYPCTGGKVMNIWSPVKCPRACYGASPPELAQPLSLSVALLPVHRILHPTRVIHSPKDSGAWEGQLLGTWDLVGYL